MERVSTGHTRGGNEASWDGEQEAGDKVIKYPGGGARQEEDGGSGEECGKGRSTKTRVSEDGLCQGVMQARAQKTLGRLSL